MHPRSGGCARSKLGKFLRLRDRAHLSYGNKVMTAIVKFTTVLDTVVMWQLQAFKILSEIFVRYKFILNENVSSSLSEIRLQFDLSFLKHFGRVTERMIYRRQ